MKERIITCGEGSCIPGLTNAPLVAGESEGGGLGVMAFGRLRGWGCRWLMRWLRTLAGFGL